MMSAATQCTPFTACRNVLCAIGVALLGVAHAHGQCPAQVPAQGAALRGAAPLFPPTNWWNHDISAAPVDPSSASFIAFINNGGTRRLHPDFGGEAAPGSAAIYGMPYAVVGDGQPKVPVTFNYSDESDGVDASGAGVPFYPLPAQAAVEPHWVEGGAPANADQRGQSDRHLIVVDCVRAHLYELYNVWHDAASGRWYAGSGAFFDMTKDDRRPDGWTSADAAGLAILPGLVRFEEAWDPAVAEIGHAFRLTVRATNGYVYPASHRAGSTPGALPMGARLRLKLSVAGADPALRSADPNVRKIFRAMQKHGLIVADNGSDLYVTGTFDVRWNNDVLNPAFALLTASDFDVVALGWKPANVANAVATLEVAPASVAGGTGAVGTVTLAAPAPAGGAEVALASAAAAVAVPSSVIVAPTASAGTFPITTAPVAATTATTLSATYGGITRTATLVVTPAAPALAAWTVEPATVRAGVTAVALVTLSAPAPAGGTTVTLASSDPAVAGVPATVVVREARTTVPVRVTTRPTRRAVPVTLTAALAGIVRTAAIAVTVR